MMSGSARRSTGLSRLLPGWLRVPSQGAAEYRYELERKLHDGPAEGLSALALELALISATAGDRQLAVRIAEMGGNVCQLVDRLRALGSAIYPPTLQAGLEPAWTSVAEHCDLRLRLDLSNHELNPRASARVGLLVADHLRTLEPGTTVQVRVRGKRFVRVHLTEQRAGSNSAQRRRFWAVPVYG